MQTRSFKSLTRPLILQGGKGTLTFRRSGELHAREHLIYFLFHELGERAIHIDRAAALLDELCSPHRPKLGMPFEDLVEQLDGTADMIFGYMYVLNHPRAFQTLMLKFEDSSAVNDGITPLLIWGEDMIDKVLQEVQSFWRESCRSNLDKRQKHIVDHVHAVATKFDEGLPSLVDKTNMAQEVVRELHLHAVQDTLTDTRNGIKCFTALGRAMSERGKRTCREVAMQAAEVAAQAAEVAARSAGVTTQTTGQQKALEESTRKKLQAMRTQLDSRGLVDSNELKGAIGRWLKPRVAIFYGDDKVDKAQNVVATASDNGSWTVIPITDVAKEQYDALICVRAFKNTSTTPLDDENEVWKVASRKPVLLMVSEKGHVPAPSQLPKHLKWLYVAESKAGPSSMRESEIHFDAKALKDAISTFKTFVKERGLCEMKDIANAIASAPLREPNAQHVSKLLFPATAREKQAEAPCTREAAVKHRAVASSVLSRLVRAWFGAAPAGGQKDVRGPPAKSMADEHADKDVDDLLKRGQLPSAAALKEKYSVRVNRKTAGQYVALKQLELRGDMVMLLLLKLLRLLGERTEEKYATTGGDIERMLNSVFGVTTADFVDELEKSNDEEHKRVLRFINRYARSSRDTSACS